MHQSRNALAAYGEDHGKTICPLQTIEDHIRADIHQQMVEDPRPEQVDKP